MFDPSQIRAIVVDCDGTLINSQEQLTQRTKDAVQAFLKTGREFYIATGRGLQTTLPVALEIGVPEYLILCNGALLWNIPQHTSIFEMDIPRQDFFSALTLLRNSNLGYVVYHENDILYEANTFPKMDMYLQRIKDMGLVAYQRSLDDLKSVQKIVVFGEESEAKVFNQQLEKDNPEQLSMVLTRPYVHNQAFKFDYTFVEIMTAGVNKSSGLAKLAEIRGISLCDIMAFGDELNDMEMICAAGWGVAMGNGREELKAIADDTTLWHDEDGIAIYIEKYFL